MKTEFVDVNETRKNVRVEIPSDVVDAEIDRVARDYSRKARDPRVPPGQGAGARHQAALQGSDPPRRRARSDPARRGRCAARARRRAGRHARHPRRDGRGRPAADVHGVVRHACRRSIRATTRRSRCGGRRARVEDEAVDAGAAAAARARRALRAGRRPRRRSTATRSSLDLERDATPSGDTADTPPGRQRRDRRARRTRRGSTSSCSGLEAGATKTFTVHYPADYPIAELAGTDVSYTVTVKELEAARAAGARRRVREGSGRVRDARRAARRGCARISSTRREHAAERDVRGELMKQLARAGAVRRAGVARRARARSPARGVRAPADGAEHRSAAGRHRLARVPRQPARGGARSGGGARWCSTRSRGASSSR